MDGRVKLEEVTERLYYTDSYLREFRARVTERSAGGLRVYLDRTAFYPTSGGQPHDYGTIAGVEIENVIDEGERIAHVAAAPVAAGDVECRVDWERRFDHMQQHSGQHLLSAVFIERLGMPTVSFHLGQESSTIDLETASLDAAQVLEAERRANEAVFENRALRVTFEDAAETRDLRKASEREGTLRIVSIDGLDRSACGGTHVTRTGEIGPILLRKLDKIRNTVRVEFLCGGRAVRRARADFDALSRVSRLFSGALDEVPALVAAQLEVARANDKLRHKLETDLAGYQGRELYSATAPDSAGMRRALRRLASGNLEELRALAQSFTAQPRAVFAGALDDPPAVLLAASEDSGLDAGKLLKAALTAAGGRGGGNQRLAQGSVPAREALEQVLSLIRIS
ncbi:MAG TPA: DHHA1 domain-containing protein [Bryobacteraceae bacterium]|nr:DHHA1 domain-containing protein [Bryobacteraceae bacterium]